MNRGNHLRSSRPPVYTPHTHCTRTPTPNTRHRNPPTPNPPRTPPKDPPTVPAARSQSPRLPSYMQPGRALLSTRNPAKIVEMPRGMVGGEVQKGNLRSTSCQPMLPKRPAVEGIVEQCGFEPLPPACKVGALPTDSNTFRELGNFIIHPDDVFSFFAAWRQQFYKLFIVTQFDKALTVHFP